MESVLGNLEELNAKSPRPPALPLTMDFGAYELLEEIGRGGQGVVFRARQKSLNRTVALKVIGLGPWATAAHLKRFRREAEAAASLEHPRIVPIYEIGERDGSCYFSMKCIDGGPLDEFVRREPMPIRAAVELIIKLARTVQFAHERGILHRDIKPGNILVDAHGEPHLTDFGLARLIETESTVTRTRDVLGTPSYIAPEQAVGNSVQVTSATDVYGLGAVFYQLLTGHPPFAGGTTYQTIRLVLEAEPRRPKLWNSKVDRDLETICLKCLEKDHRHRYLSALKLAEDLERWLRHEPIRARRIGLIMRGRKWARRNPALTVLVPMLIVLAATLAITPSRSKRERPPAGIAVLPFENLGSDKQDAAFADGIQDDILTKLAKIDDLKVISRTSVMQYRGEHDVRKIGRALNVSHVLEGTVRRSDRRIRLNAQLIDANTDQHIWAEQYDRELTDVFALQSELAQKIASQLSAVSAAEKKAIESVPTRDLEAYEMYRQAKTLSEPFSTADPATFERCERAAALLEKVIARDPNFALAYCLLTKVDLTVYWGEGRADLSRRSRAEAALHAAERLAPEAGETHLARAVFYHYGTRDLDHALEEMETAARLLPNDASIFETSAKLERRLGRWSESTRHFAKAIELDPRDPSALTSLIISYRLLRRYRDLEQLADRGIAAFPEVADQFWNYKAEAALDQGAIAQAQAAVAKMSAGARFPFVRIRIALYRRDYAEAERLSLALWEPNDVRDSALVSALIARAAGDTDKMRSYLNMARSAYEPLLSQQDPKALSDVGLIDVALGRKEEGLREARKAVDLRPIASDALEGPEYVSILAQAYLLSGEHERAIEQLASLVKLPHGPTYGELKLDPIWDDLRSDPRFVQLVAEATKPLSIQ